MVKRSDLKGVGVGTAVFGVICIVGGVALTFLSPWWWIAAVPLILLGLWLIWSSITARYATCPHCGQPTSVLQKESKQVCDNCKEAFSLRD